MNRAVEHKGREGSNPAIDENHLLCRITLAICEAADLRDAMAVVLKHIGEATGWAYGEAWVPGADRSFLERRVFWHVEHGSFSRFSEASKNTIFPKGVGLPGEAWAAKKPLWIPDVASDINYRRAKPVKEAGFKAGVVFPVLSGEEVVSVIAFYMLEACGENESLMRLVSMIGARLGTLIKKKQAEDELRKSEERLRNLVEATSDWIWETDENCRYTYVSPLIRDLLGYEPEEVIGKSPFDLMPKEEAERVSAIFAPIAAERRPFSSLENVNIHKDGHLVVIETSGVPVLDVNGFRGYRGIDRDVTRLRDLDARLFHSQKMEALGQLAAGIAHDFNNALTGIIGFGNLLLIKRGGDDLARKFAEQIVAAGESAAGLVQGILAFSRKQVMNPWPTDINELVLNFKKLLARLIGEDIELTADLAGDPLIVKADTALMEQALMNIATNARDAMPGGGKITVCTETVYLSTEFVRSQGYGGPGLYALLTFADTGTGMDEDVKKRIFEPFFTTKEVGKGTGLGLAMVYGTVKQHNGYIQVDSQRGKGTTFKIYLPIIVTIAGSKGSAGSGAHPGGSEVILLAEDDVHVQRVMQTLLEDSGYTVLLAVNGEDAVNKFMENKDRIGLLISDIVMPKKGGMEAYQEIRRVRPEIKVLFMSGYAADKGKDIFEKGLDFISKPVLPGDFLIKVREVIER